MGSFSDWKLTNTIDQAMRRQGGGVPVRRLAAPRSLTGVGFSDHASYWNAGYNAVMVTDTAFYRNPHYHQASDIPETLDYERLVAVTHQLHRAVLQLSR
jgi:hypothetical protein